MKKFIKFIKNLSDGGLAEDMYAAMERILDEDTNKEKMVNKQEFIEKAWQWLKAHIKIETISYNDVWDVSEVEILATDFDTIDEMEESFRKIMEE
jgi:hypothetical protein